MAEKGDNGKPSEQPLRNNDSGPSRIFFVILVLVLVFLLLYCLTGCFTRDKHKEIINPEVIKPKLPDPNQNGVLKFIFLNPVDKTRLHYSLYHVIVIKHVQKNETYIMHLKKPKGLYDFEGHQEYHSEMDCVYSGTILSLNRTKIGTAALSSCYHGIAFEGFINLDGEYYHITPHHTGSYASKLRRMRKRSFSKNNFSQSHSFSPNNTLQSNHSVDHKLVKAQSSALSSYHRKDSKTVPPDVLKKAHEQMLKDQENLEDETSDDNEDNSNNNEFESSSFAQLDNSEEKIGTSYLEETALNSQKNRKKATSHRNTNKNARTVTKVIELAIFTDEAFYRKWAAEYPQDTVKRINQYILTLVNNMNYLYAQPTMKERITFRLVLVEIQKTTPRGLKTSPKAEKYLNAFCEYAGSKDTHGALWDHAMMITGYDLQDSWGTPMNLGIAYTSTMCLRYYSCSLIENVKGFETAYTATHEVGHSLGMWHDGDSMNRNCDESKYMMAAMAGDGQIHWSDCSNKNIQQFFASGDPAPHVQDMKSVPRCLIKRGSKKTTIPYNRGKFPGDIFNVKGQCETACPGDGCVPYVTNSHPYNNICWMLYCVDRANVIFGAHPALEGTVCGTNKRCRIGRCM